MEDFERFTEKTALEKGEKSLKIVDPIHELSSDSEDEQTQEKERLLHCGVGTDHNDTTE